MDLHKIYYKICNIGNQRGTKKVKGFELHHILPASFFKTRKVASYNENLCILTPKEHYVVHHILSKISNEPKMIYAFYLMTNTRNYNYKLSCKEYENIKSKHCEYLSTLFKGRIFSDEWKRKLSEAKIGFIPWNKGSILTEDQKQNHKGFNKGHTTWNKGIPMSEEQRNKMSVSRKGRIPWNKGLIMTEEQKINHKGFTHGSTPWNKINGGK
jgi:hypothetical protein